MYNTINKDISRRTIRSPSLDDLSSYDTIAISRRTIRSPNLDITAQTHFFHKHFESNNKTKIREQNVSCLTLTTTNTKRLDFSRNGTSLRQIRAAPRFGCFQVK